MVDINALKINAPKLNHKSKENNGQGSQFAIRRIHFNDYVDAIVNVIEQESSADGYKFDLGTLIEEVQLVRDRALDEITSFPLHVQWAVAIRYKHAIYNAIKHHRIASPYSGDTYDDEDEEAKMIRIPKSLTHKLVRLHNTSHVFWDFDLGISY